MEKDVSNHNKSFPISNPLTYQVLRVVLEGSTLTCKAGNTYGFGVPENLRAPKRSQQLKQLADNLTGSLNYSVQLWPNEHSWGVWFLGSRFRVLNLMLPWQSVHKQPYVVLHGIHLPTFFSARANGEGESVRLSV